MHVLRNVRICKHISSKDRVSELSILTIPDVVCSRWFLKIRKILRTQWSKRRRVRTWIMYSINIQHLAKIHMTKYDYINQTKMDHTFLIRPNKLRLQNISCMMYVCECIIFMYCVFSNRICLQQDIDWKEHLKRTNRKDNGNVRMFYYCYICFPLLTITYKFNNNFII